MAIQDVVIHTNQSTFSLPVEALKTNPPPPDPFSLGHDLWIRKIDPEAARIVVDLGEPSYFGTPKPVIQFAQMYSFVREQRVQAPPYRWDEDSRLQACIAASRMAHPTTVSLRRAGRIRYNSNSSIADVSPANIIGVAIDTFLNDTPQRDWLTESDAIRLRGLVERWFCGRPLPERVSRALWYHEYAIRTYYVEIRWVLVATALESLIHVDQYGSTRQFKCRVAQLASELGVAGMGVLEAEQAYAHRCTVAHGQQLRQLSPADRQLYGAMETILRLAILRAFEDDKFAAILNDAHEIEKRWPI